MKAWSLSFLGQSLANVPASLCVLGWFGGKMFNVTMLWDFYWGLGVSRTSCVLHCIQTP